MTDKEQIQKLEGVIDGLAKSHAALAVKVNTLETAKGVPSSVTVVETKPEPVVNADPFEIKGEGTFVLKYPSISIDGVTIKSVDIVKDAEALRKLYDERPYLFIKQEKK
jgi:hypothetical protein